MCLSKTQEIEYWLWQQVWATGKCRVLGEASTSTCISGGKKSHGPIKKPVFQLYEHQVLIVSRHSWIEKEKLGPGLVLSCDHNLQQRQQYQ